MKLWRLDNTCLHGNIKQKQKREVCLFYEFKLGIVCMIMM
jgi:hypothetical protein